MSDESSAATAPSRGGRARVTTHGELSHVALTMFFERGFDKTTVDDIVKAAGIGRRTFFRYFPSKNDLPWGEFDGLLNRMRAQFEAMPPDLDLAEALRSAVVDFNRFPRDELPYHRERMWLLLNVPSLVAHSTLRYASWRQVIADFVAQRRGESPDALAPRTIAWVCLGISISSYEQWLEEDAIVLPDLIDRAFRDAAGVFSSLANTSSE